MAARGHLLRSARRWSSPSGLLVAALLVAGANLATWASGLNYRPTLLQTGWAVVAALLTGGGREDRGDEDSGVSRSSRPTGRSETTHGCSNAYGSFWVKGVLQHSLKHIARIEFGLAQRPDAVAPRAGIRVHGPGQHGQVLPSGTSRAAVFDDLGQALLVLGAPGSGEDDPAARARPRAS